MPLFIRKFIVDAIEGALSAVFVLNLVIPATLSEASAQGAIVGVAVLTAVIAAFRRNTPAGLAWLRDKLGVTE